MRNLKRVLSLALALVMVLGMMVITTSAADFTDADEITYTEAVDVMSAIGVINGYEAADGTFYFDGAKKLSRAEGAALVCYMLMGKENADKLTGSGQFTDVPADHWAAGEIDYCFNLGFIAGNGDGTFNPEGPLTSVGFGRMLLGALGYDGKTEGYIGDNWATAISSDMIEIGLDVKGVAMDAQLTREQAAQMALQTLTKTMVGYTGGMDITTGDTSIKVGATCGNIGQGNYTTYLIDSDGTTPVATGNLQFCEKYFSNLKKVQDLSANGMDYYKWYVDANEDGTLAATESAATVQQNAVVATYTTGVENVTLKALAALVGDAVTMDVYENGDNTNPADVTTDKTSDTKPFDTKYEGATVEIIKNTGTNAGTYIVNVTYGYLAKVTGVTAATASADRFITMTVYNNSTTAAGVDYITDEYAEGDLLMVYPNGDITTTGAWDADNDATGFNYDNSGTEPSCNILAVKPIEGTVEGKLTAQENSNATLTLGETAYVPAAAALGVRGVDAATTTVLGTTYTTGTNYEFVLSNGYLFGFADAEVVNQVITDLVFIDAVHSVAGKYGTTYEVVTITMGGEVKVIEAATSPTGWSTAGIYKLNYTAGALTSVTAVAVDDIDNSTYYYGGNVVKSSQALNDKVTYVVEDANSDEDRLHVSESTKIFYVDGAYNIGDLKVTAYNAIPKMTTGSDVFAVASLALDGAYDLEVLILDDSTLDPVVIPGEAIYYSTGTSLKGEVYVDGRKVSGSPATTAYQHEVYNIVTGEKETIVTVDTSDITVGFYKVTADEWGVLTTTTTGAPAAAGGNDATGVYSIAKGTDTLTLERGYLTISGGTYSFTDAVVGEDTVVINAIVGGNTMTLAQYVAAYSASSAATAKIYVVVDPVTSAKDVACIILTGYTAAP